MARCRRECRSWDRTLAPSTAVTALALWPCLMTQAIGMRVAKHTVHTMSRDEADPVVLHRAVSIRTNEPCAFLTIKREHYKLALERTKAVVVRANCGCCIAKRASLTYALAPQQEDIRSLLLSSKLFQGLDPEQVDAFVGGVRSTMGRAAASTCYSPNTASVTTIR